MNHVIYFLFISMLFLNCENDIDINADWEEIPVIYSILNPGADNDCDGDGVLNLNDEDGCKENYIRIQKSFIDTRPANEMAQISDSIYYSQNQSLVWIEEICGNDTISFDLEFISSLEKPDDGYFSNENHHFYKFSEQLNHECQYKVSFMNLSTGKISYATTNVVEPIDVSQWPTLQSQQGIGTTPTNGTGADGLFELIIPQPGFSPIKKQIKIDPSKNGKLYKMFLRFNYVEVDQETGIKDTLFVDWNFGSKIASETQVSGDNSTEKIIFDFNSIQFFQHLASSIPIKDNVFRYAIVENGGIDGVVHPCLDFHFEILDINLYNYFSSQNSSGLIQNRPIYTNIQDGVGLFSSVSTQSFYGIKMSDNTNYDLATSVITSSLNFRCFNNVDDIIDLGFNCQ